MRRKRYKLNFLQIFMICSFLAAGMAFVLNPEPYIAELTDGNTEFHFLQKGDYVLDVTYNGSPENNLIIICSDLTTGEDNRAGKEFLRQPLSEGGGIVRLPLHLEAGTYGVAVRTESDLKTDTRLERIYIQSVGLFNNDNYFLGILCFAAACTVFLAGLFMPWERYRSLLIPVIFGLAASMPLFSDFLIGREDMNIHVARLEGVFQGMRAGEFPVYVNTVQTAGYGNLSSAMYPQLFLYPAAALRFLNLSLMLCYKLILVGINIGTALLTYHAVKRICRSGKTAYLASLFYTFSIYRLTDVYYRGALGESLAMTFFPLVLWGIYEILWGDRKRWYLLMLGMTGVLQSHVLSVEMCLMFLVAETVSWIIAVRFRNVLSGITAGLKATAGTLLLNAFFLIPFLFFSQEPLQVFHMPNEVGEHAVYFSQMFAVFPNARGASLSLGTTVDEMPLTVGGVLLGGAVLFCVMTARERGKDERLSAGKHCLCFGAASLILSSRLFPWEILAGNDTFAKLSAPLQFAWRFLGPASLFLCIVSAIGVTAFAEESGGRQWVIGAMIFATLCSAAYYFDRMSQETAQWSDKMALEGMDDCDALYMYRNGEKYEALNLDYRREDAYVRTLGPDIVCEDYRKQGTGISVKITSFGERREEDYLLFPLYYYPGYVIEVNGERTEALSKDRLVACELPEEPAEIKVRYEGPGFFRAANAVSLLTMLSGALYFAIFSVAKYIKKS